MKLHPHLPIKYGFDKENPPRPGAVSDSLAETGYFTPSWDDRLWMFHHRWEPPEDKDINATLMIVHGTVDHGGVYQDLALNLNKAGIAVFAMDMRGWGMSDGESMYVHNIEDFVQDVVYLEEQIRALPRYADVKPHFVMGKSLGGTVAAYCVAQHPNLWTGLLGLSGGFALSPTLGHAPSAPVISMLRGLAMVFPKTPIKPLFDESLLMSDADALQAWRDDGLCCKDYFKLGYVLNLLEALTELPESVVPKINLPMLMMCGESDQVVTVAGHQMMIDNSQHDDKKLKTYTDGRHNLLQEPALKAQVAVDIQEWILLHT